MTAPFDVSEAARKASQKTVVAEAAPSTPPIISLDEKVMEELTRYVDDWLRTADSEHSVREGLWKKQNEQFAAKMPASRNFPFEGSSRVTVPVTAMSCDPIYSRLMNSVFGQNPIFVAIAFRKEFMERTKPMQDWIDFYLKRVARFREEGKYAFLELVNNGTCIFKTVYDKEIRIIKEYGLDGKTILDREATVFEGPKPYWCPLGDFIIPEQARSVESAPIVFHRVRLTWEQLQEMQFSGKVANINDIQNHFQNHKTEIEQSRMDEQKVSINFLHEYELFECWFDFDIDRTNGQSTKLVGLYEPYSMTFIQLRLNWYFHQRRPFTIIPLYPQANSLYGRGTAEMVESMQEEITMMHRLRDDNATLANTRMFIAKKNSGIERVPRIYTGRTFFVDDPQKDFLPFAAADIYPSLVQEEMQLFGYVEKVTGVGDYMRGRESPIAGSRATATSTLALLQEGSKRVQQTLDEVHNGLWEVLSYCIEIWNQFGVGDLPKAVLGDEAGQQVIDTVSYSDRMELLGGIGFELNVSSAAMNKEVQKQTLLALVQILQGYYDRMVQGAMMVANPMVPPFVKQVMEEIATAQQALFKRTIELFDVRNMDELLPNLEALIELAKQSVGPGGQPGASGGMEGASGSPQGDGGVGGMEASQGPVGEGASALRPASGIGQGALRLLQTPGNVPGGR